MNMELTRTVRQIADGDICPNCAPDCVHFSDKANCCVAQTAIGRLFIGRLDAVLCYTPY